MSLSNRTFQDVTKDSTATSTLSSSIHYLPFKVQYDGPADVKTLFSDQIYKKAEKDEVLLNRFRGRPLSGKKLDLPKNYGGIVITDLQGGAKELEEDIEGGENINGSRGDAGIGDDKHLSIKITKRFESITYWNWDKVPSKMDAPVKLMDWLELSQIVHQPVD